MRALRQMLYGADKDSFFVTQMLYRRPLMEDLLALTVKYLGRR